MPKPRNPTGAEMVNARKRAASPVTPAQTERTAALGCLWASHTATGIAIASPVTKMAVVASLLIAQTAIMIRAGAVQMAALGCIKA